MACKPTRWDLPHAKSFLCTHCTGAEIIPRQDSFPCGPCSLWPSWQARLNLGETGDWGVVPGTLAITRYGDGETLNSWRLPCTNLEESKVPIVTNKKTLVATDVTPVSICISPLCARRNDLSSADCGVRPQSVVSSHQDEPVNGETTDWETRKLAGDRPSPFWFCSGMRSEASLFMSLASLFRASNLL